MEHKTCFVEVYEDECGLKPKLEHFARHWLRIERSVSQLFALTEMRITHVDNWRNKNQPDALSFLIYFNKYPLHVSNRLIIHHQETVYCACSIWYLSCIHVDLAANSSQSTWMHDKYHRLTACAVNCLLMMNNQSIRNM